MDVRMAMIRNLAMIETLQIRLESKNDPANGDGSSPNDSDSTINPEQIDFKSPEPKKRTGAILQW